MKDLIPEKKLGTYFSRRTSYMQILGVVLSLVLALLIDYIKKNFPANEIDIYVFMFIGAGVSGLIGTIALSRVPEPESYLGKENILSLLKRPLRDGNFRRLVVFNSAWQFALNLAAPFFTVFMLRSMNLSLPYIIGLSIVSQLFSILTVRVWGRYADKYSNKTIIAIGAPLYIICLLAWCFVGIYTNPLYSLVLLFGIHILMGISTAGINLSLTNIGLKLAPSNQSIVYLTANNIISALFSSLAPLLGGYLADFFLHRSLAINAQWSSPKFNKVLHLVSLHEWNFLFLISAVLSFIALEFLVALKETGEVRKDEVVRVMRANMRSTLKEYFLIGYLVSWQEQLWNLIRRKAPPE
jgi:MFS family permease